MQWDFLCKIQKPAEPKFCWFSMHLFYSHSIYQLISFYISSYKIKIFIIEFSHIILSISIYLIFYKHIASMKLFLNFLMTHLLKFYYIYNPIILL